MDAERQPCNTLESFRSQSIASILFTPTLMVQSEPYGCLPLHDAESRIIYLHNDRDPGTLKTPRDMQVEGFSEDVARQYCPSGRVLRLVADSIMKISVSTRALRHWFLAGENCFVLLQKRSTEKELASSPLRSPWCINGEVP